MPNQFSNTYMQSLSNSRYSVTQKKLSGPATGIKIAVLAVDTN